MPKQHSKRSNKQQHPPTPMTIPQQRKPIIVFVGTKNQSKLLSASNGLKPFYPKDRFEISLFSTRAMLHTDVSESESAEPSSISETLNHKTENKLSLDQLAKKLTPAPNQPKRTSQTITNHIIGIDVESGVSDQPLSASETITGARNRMKNIRAIIDHTPSSHLQTCFAALGLSSVSRDQFYFVGIEGGLEKVYYEGQSEASTATSTPTSTEEACWFDSGYICVQNNAGVTSVATSARTPVADFIVAQLKPDHDISKVTKVLSQSSAHFMDLITLGALTRSKSYENGITFAFSRFQSEEKYWVANISDSKA